MDQGKKTAVPCAQCPFRRTAMRGYLGGHREPNEITDIVVGDGRFPCHMEVTNLTDRGRPVRLKFHRAVEMAEVCAGSAAMLSNMLKRSRDRDVSTKQSEVGKRADVFNNPQEFCEYHNHGPLADVRRKVIDELMGEGILGGDDE